jgi:predicted DNA-binding transcriptional regulator AlpA
VRKTNQWKAQGYMATQVVTAYGNERTASEMLAVSLATLRRLRALGDGPAFVRFGKCVRYSLADVEAWAASKQATRD